MASGYEVKGTDLDSIFAPWHSGWPQASVTGYEVAGTDLNARYAPLSTGSAAAATGYEKGGTDLNAIFAGLGTTSVKVETQPGNVSGSAAAGTPSGTVTSGTTSCAGTKGGGTYTYTCHIASGSATPTAPSSATSGVTNSAVPAGTTLTGTMYWTISDGTTSVNTNTVDWSLTNTTPASWTFGITAGERTSGSNAWTGYIADPALGSGTNLTQSGLTIVELYDLSQTDDIQSATLSVSGFSADPGQNWFASIASNGVTHTPGESTLTYAYSAGVATWTWSIYGSTSVWFNFVSGDTYSATITF